MRAHDDVGGVIVLCGIEDFEDGCTVDLSCFNGDFGVACAKVDHDFGEPFGGMPLADVYGFLEIFHGEAVIAGEHRGLNNVEKEDAILGHVGKGAGGFDHTLRSR